MWMRLLCLEPLKVEWSCRDAMGKVTCANTRKKEGLSLMSSEVKRLITELEPKGLCMTRFKADIETIGVDYSQLAVGDQLSLGEMRAVITRVGKSCHASDCVVFDPEVPCKMMKEVLFGEILVDGPVAVDDQIIVLKQGTKSPDHTTM